MRVVFESDRIPVRATFPDGSGTRFDGLTKGGEAWLCVRAFERTEPLPPQHDHARPVATILSLLPHGGAFRSALPPLFETSVAVAREVVVPREVLESVTPQELVGIDWEFEPGG
jgi:hypothetical protein